MSSRDSINPLRYTTDQMQLIVRETKSDCFHSTLLCSNKFGITENVKGFYCDFVDFI